MFRKMAYNHIKKNRLVTILLTLFITAASFLVSLAAIMTEDLLKSADAFVEQTKLPHFLQMHEGELDRVRLNEFADSQEDVLSLQISDFLNIDNSQLVMAEHSMTDQVGDNGFCVQNKEFDYLIDSNQNVIQPDEGEVYVPICYWKAFDLKSGDQMMVGKKQLTIAGFLRDGQMNSSFASSKRFLISEKDYEEIKPHGEEEYLIEFRLKDEKAVSAFSEAYTAAELPCNGPAITYPFFRLIQTLSDGMMIAIIVLISILIVLVAFLCIRFTLLTKLEEDFREIGIMKAIGVSAKDIRMFYLGTYIAIAVAGCSCGYICSLLVKNIFLSNIHLYMGKGSNGVLGCVLGLLGCVLIYLWIVSYVSRILRRIRQISSALALRDIGGEEKGGKNQWSLAKNTWINTNLFLGIKDVIIRKKIYITMLLLLIVTVFIMIVPQNLYQTMSSSRFITYMGVGQCQMRIDLQRQDDYEKTSMEIEKLLSQDQDVREYAVSYTRNVSVVLDDQTIKNIKLEEGDQSKFPISYVEGTFPQKENEIALSYLNAKELGKKIGSQVLIKEENTEYAMTVTGIYSDITNGGLTAKTVSQETLRGNEILWSVICVDFHPGLDPEKKVKEYQTLCPDVKVAAIEQYIRQTLGSSILAIRKTSLLSTVLGLFLAALVVSLFMRMIIVKDRYSIVVLKGIGFTNREIQLQYMTRAVLILVISILTGTFFSNTLGEKIFGIFLETMGASKLVFVANPWISYVCYPLLLLLTVLFATLGSTYAVRQMSIADHMNE